MKKTLIVLVATLMAVGAVAQQVTVKNKPEAPTRHSVSFEARQGETFVVYFDGELMNRMPRSRVQLDDVAVKSHEVVVVSKRPVEKAAVLYLTPRDEKVVVNVNYDSRLEQLYLYTPSHNRSDYEEGLRLALNGAKGDKADKLKLVAVEDVAVDEVPEVTDSVLVEILQQLRGQSFDSDRLALAKVLVTSYSLTARQIGRMTSTIDFSNSQVDFLKYAYVYCRDKGNYYDAVEVLTFSSDKRKVIDYIATQR